MVDLASGKTKVRLVDMHSEGYGVAREYMIRLEKQDFANGSQLRKLSGSAHLKPAEFKKRFSYVAGR